MQTLETQSNFEHALHEKTRPWSLRRNFLWNFVGMIVYGACNWSMQIVLAKLGTPRVVGQYALGIAISQPLIVVSQLNLRGVQSTDVKRDYHFREYLLLRIVCTMVALAAIVLCAYFGHYRVQTTWVILLMALGMAFDSVSDVIYGMLQQHERMDRISISLIARNILSLVTLAIVYRITGNIVLAVLASALSSLVVLLCYDTPSAALFLRSMAMAQRAIDSTQNPAAIAGRLSGRTWRNDLRSIGTLAWIAAPLGIVLLFNSLNTNIPRYFVAKLLGEGALGIYAAISSLLMIGQYAIVALGQPMAPRLARYYSNGEYRSFALLLVKYAGIGAAIGLSILITCMLFGSQVLTFLFTREYVRASAAFEWLLAAGALYFVSLALGVALTSARLFRAQVFWMGSTVVTSLVANWLLVPSHGLLGAAIATFIAMLVRLIVGIGLLVWALRSIDRKAAPV